MNKRVQKTREQLKGALTELLKTQPFERITVKGICDKAGVNRSTFYVHYSCPRDLVDEMEKNMLDQLPAIVSDEPKDIIASFTLLLDYIRNNSSVVEVLMRDGVDSSFGETLMRAVMDKYDEFLTIEDEVRNWIDSGFSCPSDKLASLIIDLAFRVMGQDNITLHHCRRSES